MEEELYYTPKLYDIRIGYVCQCSDGMKTGEAGEIYEDWYVTQVTTTSSLETIASMIEEGRLRARYLVLPDFDTVGWICSGKIEPPPTDENKNTDLYRFYKGKYQMIYDFIAKVVMIYISMGDIFSVCVQRFDCPSLNELSYIESRLNLT